MKKMKYHILFFRTVDNVINTIIRSFSDNLKIEIVRPFGSSTVLLVTRRKVTLGKLMKGIVVLKRLMVEWVVVKGFNEICTMKREPSTCGVSLVIKSSEK